ncbi:hypothetical protein [Fulvivirga ligni]|uniref:hypothetical protein n=1 Tax=Fulvivirga ligni TaxID=2904246 RepID=UPI001F2DEAEE|nr:hypothetical protein [Fulvivirga ligni]UII21201.1 hypothetical protein LVD16_25540 [Fulvivirga ligni]
MKNLIYIICLVVAMSSCELAGDEGDKLVSYEKEIIPTTKYEEEAYETVEIFSNESIEAEFKAIKNGFVPAIGVKARIEILKYYKELAASDIFMVIVRPKVPRPVCPPKPLTDCMIPRMELEQTLFTFFTPEVYKQNLKVLLSAKGEQVAAVSEVDVNKDTMMVLFTMKTIHPELTSRSLALKVAAEGYESIISAEMGEDTFQ